MRFVLAVGSTRTATIEGISAAGAAPDRLAQTPATDAAIVAFGRPVPAAGLPVSPTGCPTPAVVTRAVRTHLGFDLLVLDAGLVVPTAAPTVAVDASPGGDIREPVPVPGAATVFDAARSLGRALPDDELLVGESLPGGTTTALGVLRALGEPFEVSSSLPTNPIALKRDIVRDGLSASDLQPGDAAGEPVQAVRLMGDPVLAAIAGFVDGATGTGTRVTLAGGTQLVAAAALVRHAGVEAPLRLATTTYVAADEAVKLDAAAAEFDLDLVVTDPRFDRSADPALAAYAEGEAKEGVGMGGALHLAARAGVPPADVRERSLEVLEAATEDPAP